MPTLLETLAISNAADQDNPVINMGKYPTARGDCAGAVLTDSDGDELGTAGNPISTTIAGVATEATLSSMKTTVQATGASTQQIQGATAEATSLASIKPVAIAFKDVFGNAAVPTGLNASGFTVMGVWPLDGSLNFQDFTGNGEVLATGFVANDAVDSGNPIKVGGKTITNNDGLTALASGDRADLTTDRRNRLIIDSDRYLVATNSITTGAGATTIIAAPGVGLKLQVYKIKVGAVIESNNALGSSESEGVYFRFGAGAFASHVIFCGVQYDSTNKEVWGITGSSNDCLTFSPGHIDGASNEAFQVGIIGMSLGNTYSFFITAYYRVMPT